MFKKYDIYQGTQLSQQDKNPHARIKINASCGQNYHTNSMNQVNSNLNGKILARTMTLLAGTVINIHLQSESRTQAILNIYLAQKP